MEVLEGLLRIKTIRQDSRESEMRRARQRHDDAARALRGARERQAERDAQREAAERALYQDVCSRVVQLQNLRDLHLDVDVMRGEAQKDAGEVETAQSDRDARKQSLTEAVTAWQQAVRLTRKFTDLAEEARLERLAEIERLADLELEEHPLRKPLDALDETATEGENA